MVNTKSVEGYFRQLATKSTKSIIDISSRIKAITWNVEFDVIENKQVFNVRIEFLV